MDDACRVKARSSMTRDFSQPNSLYASSVNQIEMFPGQYGHPFVQQEVCVIERTIRQEPVGTNLRNFGVQDSNINSVSGDVGNSLLALVPGSHAQACSNYQQQTSNLRSTITSSNLQGYQMGTLGPGAGNWPVHHSNASVGTGIGGLVPGHGPDALNVRGRDMYSSILGRDLNLSQYTRIAGTQDNFAAALLRPSEIGISKRSDGPGCGNDTSGSGTFPLWLTERSQRQREQTFQNPADVSGLNFPRTVESSRAVASSMSMNSAQPPSSSTTRVPRAVCINQTRRKFGGELRFTRSGLVGVVCSCHGSFMSVVQFTEHVGIRCSNPGGALSLDGTGESLIQWRRTLLSENGVKVPDDNQGWDWSEGEDMEFGITNRKAMFAPSWQKEADGSCGNSTLNSRVAQTWDGPVLPSTSNSFPSAAPSQTNIGFSSPYDGRASQDSRERALKSFGKGFGMNALEFGSCSHTREHFDDGLNRGSSTLQSLRNPSRMEPSSSAEFFNFISGTQVMSGHSEQLAVERRMALGNGGMMRGVNITWNDRIESAQHEKDNCNSSIELRLGQPSQHSQSVGPPLSTTTSANQMHRVFWQTVMDTGKTRILPAANRSEPSEFPPFTGQQASFHDRPFDRQATQVTDSAEPSRQHPKFPNVLPERGFGGNSPAPINAAIFEDAPVIRHPETMRNERQNFNEDVEGVRWFSTVGRGFGTRDEGILNSEQTLKQQEDEAQRIPVSSMRPASREQPDLDTIVGQQWPSKGCGCYSQRQPFIFSGHIEGRHNHDGGGQNVTHSHGTPAIDSEGMRATCPGLSFAEGHDYEGNRSRQGCACSIPSTSSYASSMGRASVTLGETRDYRKEQSLEADIRRLGVTRDTGEGASAKECSCSGVRQLRTFPVDMSQGLACCISGPENPVHKSSYAPLPERSPAPVLAQETASERSKKFSNLDGRTPCQGLKEASGTNQWKETSGGLVHGNGIEPDARLGNASPPRVDLEEDLLADTATKATSPTSNASSDKQQPVSGVDSKSSENNVSGLSRATANEICPVQPGDHISIDPEVVDEGSGIGKCSSSDGVDTGMVDTGTMPNLNFSCKDDAQKLASPSSNGYPSLCNVDERSEKKPGTRSAEGHQVRKCPVDEVERDDCDTVQSGKKKVRVLKCKRLDILTSNGDAKRQKISALGTSTRNFDISSTPKDGSDVSSSDGHNPSSELSPTSRGASGTLKAQRISRDISEQQEARVNLEEGSDHLAPNDRAPKQKETLVIRVPQGINRQKAKRSGRHRPARKSMGEVMQSGTPREVISSKDVKSPNFDSAHVESDVTGSYVPEPIAVTGKSKPNHILKLQVQPVAKGRVTLGRPSPGSATRTMSLKAILGRPADVNPGSHVKTSCVTEKSVLPAVRNKPITRNREESDSPTLKSGLKEATSKELPQRVSTVNGSNSAETAGVRNPSLKAKFKVPGPKEEPKRPAQSLPKQQGRLEDQGFKSGSRMLPKLTPPSHESKPHSKGDGREVLRGDTLAVPSKPVVKSSLSRSGSNAAPAKQDSQVMAASVAKGPPVKSVINGGSTRIRSSLSAAKNNLKAFTLPASVPTEKFEVLPPRSFTLSAANDFRAPPFRHAKKIGTSSLVNVEIQSRLTGERLKGMGNAEGRIEVAAGSRDSQELFPESSGATPELIVNKWHHRSKRSASRSSPNIPSRSIPLTRGPNFPVPTHIVRESVPSDDLKRKVKAKVQDAVVVPLSQDNSDTTRLGSSRTTAICTPQRRPHKHDAQKVRSLHEITAESKLLKSNTGVFDFHDDSVGLPVMLGNASSSELCKPSEAPFSVPVYLNDGRRLIPHGERSERPIFAKLSSILPRTMSTQPPSAAVEIVVKDGSSCGGKRLPSSAKRPAREREDISRVEMQPVSVTSVVKQTEKKRIDNIASLADQIPCSSSGLNQAVQLGSENRVRVLKRSLKQLNKSDGLPKKRKLPDEDAPSIAPSALVIKKRDLHACVPVLSTSNLEMIAAVKNISIECQVLEDGVKISGKKNRCSRPKRYHRTVPKGVVECCVCDRTVSDMSNQILCCSKCPVKVHQLCYGINKVPLRDWVCRTCKAAACQPVCVLCGYGGGAMTRARKAKFFVKSFTKLWQEKGNIKEMAHSVLPESLNLLLRDHKDIQQSESIPSQNGRVGSEPQNSNRVPSGINPNLAIQPQDAKQETMMDPQRPWLSTNTITLGALDANVIQWVHMICALWMPGTKCLNNDTMGIFDVSGVAPASRKLICSICQQKGGACILCRADKCGAPLHVWCAHEKNLLRNEVEDVGDQVGFYGKCMRHANGSDLLIDTRHVPDSSHEVSGAGVGHSTCARTQAYKGRPSLVELAGIRRQIARNRLESNSREFQKSLNAWLKISEDSKEFISFDGTTPRRLSVYKSQIHGLGLYTANPIEAKAEVVEYIGEIVGLRVADKREAEYHSRKRMQTQGACYLFRIDKEWIIDATRRGGIARFVNHSCSPNCSAKVISEDNKSKVVFYSLRDIFAGEEITYDYQFNFEQDGDKIPCFCGSDACRGSLN